MAFLHLVPIWAVHLGNVTNVLRFERVIKIINWVNLYKNSDMETIER